MGVIGLMIALLAVVAILSPLPQETSFISVFFVSAFGFVGFWVFFAALFVFGIYIMFNRRLMKVRFDITMGGVLAIVIAVLIIISNFASTETTLSLNNFIDVFKAISSDLESSGIIYDWRTGGGYVGFFLAGLFNSVLTYVGSLILTFLILLSGLGLVINREIKKWFIAFKKHRQLKKEQGTYFRSIKTEKPLAHDDITFQTNVDLPLPAKEEIAPIIASKPQSVMAASAPQGFDSYRFQVKSFDGEKGLHKAVFVMDGDIPKADDKEIGNDMSSLRPTIETAKEETIVQPVISKQDGVRSEGVVNPLIKEKKAEMAPEISKPVPIKVRSYTFPPLSLLQEHESNDDLMKNDASTAERTELMNTIFDDLGVGASVIGHTIGPSVTRFDVKMNKDVSVTSMNRYISDISIRLGGIPTRFEQIVIGKTTSGLEIPNEVRTNVGLKEALAKMPTGERYNRDVPFGKNISGDLIYANLDDLPHMLVAGSTGSGKSIFVHSLIMSLIMRNRPDELKIMVVDPKRVELSNYADIPHLLCPIIVESKKAKVAFNKLVDEMEKRYTIFEKTRVSKISQYNRVALENGLPKMPYIVVFVDEYADLSDTCRDIHEPVVRVAQKARAAGIHLIISTQRPTADVVNPRIKTNLPTHIALMMGNFTDSTTIIGEAGAEKLLGNGDMLVECAAISRTSKSRLQGCYVDIEEINRVVDYLKAQWTVEYDPNFIDLEEKVPDFVPSNGASVMTDGSSKEMEEEELYHQLVEDTMQRDFSSISFIQRTYGVGFPKAGRLFNRLQKDGIVSTINDSARGCKVIAHDPSFNAPSVNPGSSELVSEKDNE